MCLYMYNAYCTKTVFYGNIFCELIQMTVEVNVEKPWLITGPDEEFFEFEMNKVHELGYNASVIELSSCLRFSTRTYN